MAERFDEWITVASISSVAILTGLPALQVEDQLLVGCRQSLQRRTLRRHRGQSFLKQGQVVLVKTVEEVARRLCSRKLMADQLGQRLVLAELIEVLGALAAGRPQRQEALDHLRGGQAALARLELDRALDDRGRAGEPIRLDEARNAGTSRHQARLQLGVDLEIQPPRHAAPLHPLGERYLNRETASTPDYRSAPRYRQFASRGSREDLVYRMDVPAPSYSSYRTSNSSKRALDNSIDHMRPNARLDPPHRTSTSGPGRVRMAMALAGCISVSWLVNTGRSKVHSGRPE